MLFFCGAQHALVRQQIRYPQPLEHDGNQRAAYVNELTGILMTLSSEFAIETAAHALIAVSDDLPGIATERRNAVSDRVDTWQTGDILF